MNLSPVGSQEWRVVSFESVELHKPFSRVGSRARSRFIHLEYAAFPFHAV